MEAAPSFSFSARQREVSAGGRLLEVGELALEPLQPVARGLVALLLQRLALDLQLDDAAVELVELLGLGIDLHAEPRGGLVHEVDRLVGQEAVGDVAVGEGRGRDDRRIGDAHAVMHLVLLLDAAQDGDGVLDRRLGDEDGLEAAGERGVLLDVLAVLVERGGADAVQLAAGERGLEQVRGVHRAVRLAGADEGVHLVDEEDDLPFRRGHLGEHRLQPLLELAAIFCAGDQRAHVEREQLLVLQRFRHVAVDDAERQALDDGGLADARLADQHRVVLGAAGEHLDGAADLLVAADDRVELALARRLGQVARVFLQRVVAGFGRGGVGGAALADLVDGLVEAGRRHAGIGEDLRRRRVPLHGEREQQALDGDVGIAGLLGELLGGGEDLCERRREIDLARSARHFRQLGERRFRGEERVLGTPAGALDQARRHPFGIVEQHLQKMLRRELLVALAQGVGLGGLDEAARPLRVFLEIHASLPFGPAPRPEASRGGQVPLGFGPPRRPCFRAYSVAVLQRNGAGGEGHYAFLV